MCDLVRAMKLAISYCEIIDACVCVAVFACLCYVISYGNYSLLDEEYEREEMIFDGAERLTDNGHLTRICKASASNTIQVAVDLQYSKDAPLTQDIGPSEIQEIGDSILGNLFDVCTCGNTTQNCFLWTLTINEMNYSKSDFGPCGPKQGHPVPSCSYCTDIPQGPRNATIAKIFAKGQSPLVKPECLDSTVQCAVSAATERRIFKISYVETFITNLIK